MAHNTNCAHAKRPGCECECGGARHGCLGAFEIADASEDVVRAYVAQLEKDWHTRASGVNRKQAAVGCARADVVHWLHRDWDLRRSARAAQETAFEDNPGEPRQGMVLRGLIGHLGPQRMQEFQGWAGRTHFWCELLAQLAHIIAQYEKFRKRIAFAVEDVLSQRDVPPPQGERHLTEVIGIAVHSSWRYLMEGIVASSGTPLAMLLDRGEVQPLLWPIRVIAVFMCPDASCHPAVREHCWKPIIHYGSAEVRQVVRERLTQVFPEDPWFASTLSRRDYRLNHCGDRRDDR